MAIRKTKLRRPRLTKRPLKELPIRRVLPNIATLIGLCMGLSAIRFVLLDHYELAVAAILMAAVLDAMDGRLARMLGAASSFGAELDSLADFVNFGVTPGLVIYIHSLQAWRGLGWALVLFFIVCGGLRLARFNIDTMKAKMTPPPAWMQNYFTGVPIPAAAFLVLLPLMGEFVYEAPLPGQRFLSAILLIVVGLLMISRIPTFSLKGSHVEPRKVLPLLLLIGTLMTALINAPWITLTVIGVLYFLTIPFSYRRYIVLKNQTRLS